MLESELISSEKLEEAVASIQERVELSGEYSKLFVDANILNLLVQNKNQAVYGRRGTGKTHLLGRLFEYYRDTFPEKKVLPVFLDGRNIATRSVISEINPGISLLVSYRRFLDAVSTAIEEFTNDSITLSNLDKLWPGGKKKKKLDNINKKLLSLKKLVRLGEVQVGHGKVVTQVKEDKSTAHKRNLGLDVKMTTELKKLAKTNAGIGAGFSKVSSNKADESLKVIYEGLTVINFVKISECLDSIIEELEPEAVMILFDEWSAIDLEYQPLFAEMIRTTLVAGRKIFIKFACIPYLTKLSINKPSGQSIGFPIGEEVFVDIDLDKYYSPYFDPQSVIFFLLSVLQKHLGAKIDAFNNADLNAAINYFIPNLFQNDEVVKELVQASAGVPRDFLRIFSRAFQKAKTKLPITLSHIRLATHEFFHEEKKSLIDEESKSYALFDDIFNTICLPSESYAFLVSHNHSKSRHLKEIWHHRLVHLLFKGHFAYAKEEPGSFDIYIIDYGRYVLMRGSKKGEELYERCWKVVDFVFKDNIVTPLLKSLMKIMKLEDDIKQRFSELVVTSIKIDSPDLETILDDCSEFIADPLIIRYDSDSN